MKVIDPTVQTKVQPEVLLTSLREALDKRDFPDVIDLFNPIWQISDKPDFSGFSPTNEAEFLLLAGEFLIGFGKTKSSSALIEEGKNALTNASDRFWSVGNYDKSFQSQMLLAVGYFYQGSYEEYEILLSQAEDHFQNDQSNPVYLQIEINYLIIELNKKRLKQALKRIKNLKKRVGASKNFKIKTLFYLQSGIITRWTEHFSESVKYFQKGFQSAERIGSLHHQSLILNCLANTYRCLGKYPLALETINKAIELVADNSGWLPHFLDTKANIVADSGNFDEAISFADDAVIKFEQGEDYRGYCEALWTQSKILFSLKMPEMGLTSFIRLCEIGRRNIGEKFVDNYVLEFLNYNFFTQSKGLLEKIEDLKEHQLRIALLKADGKRTEAAQILDIPHQYLSRLISKFPLLEIDFPKTKKPRNDRKES